MLMRSKVHAQKSSGSLQNNQTSLQIQDQHSDPMEATQDGLSAQAWAAGAVLALAVLVAVMRHVSKGRIHAAGTEFRSGLSRSAKDYNHEVAGNAPGVQGWIARGQDWLSGRSFTEEPSTPPAGRTARTTHLKIPQDLHEQEQSGRNKHVVTLDSLREAPTTVHMIQGTARGDVDLSSRSGKRTKEKSTQTRTPSILIPVRDHHGAAEDCDAMGSSLLSAALQQYYASIEASPQEASAHTEEERPLPSSDHSGRAQEQEVPRRRACRDIHKDKFHSEW